MSERTYHIQHRDGEDCLTVNLVLTPERRDNTPRASDRRELVIAFITFVLILAMSLWVHTQGAALQREQRQLLSQKRAVGNEFEFLTESCKRLDILRASDNLSHAADFRVFTAVLDGYKHSTSRSTVQRAFVSQLRTAIADKTWTPLTDCSKAVNLQGVAYRAHHSVRFIDRFPPESDLHARPEDLH